MMVVDTSIAMKWVLDEPGTEAAVALAVGMPLIAPSWLKAEAANALWFRVAKRDISASAATLALGAIGSMVHEWVDVHGLIDDAFAITLELDHPIYDALFLALAIDRDLPLVTADQRFSKKLEGTRYARRLIPLDVAAARA